jgi:hypothetical protein
MSRRRQITSDISTDAKVSDLAPYGVLPMLLYTWAIPHADDLGRITADPRQFRLLVCPAVETTPAEVETALEQIASVGLWEMREESGQRYFQFPLESWFKHQSYINAKKREQALLAEVQRKSPENAVEQRKSPQKGVTPTPTPNDDDSSRARSIDRIAHADDTWDQDAREEAEECRLRLAGRYGLEAVNAAIEKAYTRAQNGYIVTSLKGYVLKTLENQAKSAKSSLARAGPPPPKVDPAARDIHIPEAGREQMRRAYESQLKPP